MKKKKCGFMGHVYSISLSGNAICQICQDIRPATDKEKATIVLGGRKHKKEKTVEELKEQSAQLKKNIKALTEKPNKEKQI